MPICKICKGEVKKYTYQTKCIMCIVKYDLFIMMFPENANSKIYVGEWLHKPTGVHVKAKDEDQNVIRQELLYMLVAKLSNLSMN